MPVVPATPEAISKAAQALARGEIVAFPTETVYGLGANALDARAVARVFAAKERPRFNPLIVHVPDLETAERYALIDDTARRLAEAFWPGPLSLVLKRRAASGIADLVSAGLDTIALGRLRIRSRRRFLQSPHSPSLRQAPIVRGASAPRPPGMSRPRLASVPQ